MFGSHLHRKGLQPTRRQFLTAAAGGATVAAATAVPGLTSAATGRSEDPGFFGEVSERVDGSSFRMRLHGTGEELLILAEPGAEVGRDGAATMNEFEPGERVTALGSRAGTLVSATAVFSVADAFDGVVVSGRTGARLRTSAGDMRLDGATVATGKVGERPDAKAAPPEAIQAGSRLWVLARRDPSSKSSVIRRFASYGS
jgi:hypothetical protein